MMTKQFYGLILVSLWLSASSALGEHEHHNGAGTPSSDAVADSAHNHEVLHQQVTVLTAGPDAPSLDLVVIKDADHGWNVNLVTRNFQFAPEKVGGQPVTGEGHAHLYVDGEQVARVYGPWFHISKLPHGLVDITVTLNANDHSQLAVGEEILSVTKQVQCH